MPLNYAQHRNRVRMLAGNKLDDARVGDIVNMVLEQLWGASWSCGKEKGVLTTGAPFSVGTVTLDAVPTKVDGVGTAFTTAMIDRYFRVDTNVGLFRIVNVVGQQLTLETAYPGPAFTLHGYTIVKHIYALAADMDVLQTIAGWRKLAEVTVEQADRFDATRSFVSSGSWAFLYRGVTAAGVVQIEIQPIPSAAVAIRYSYLSAPPTLIPGADDTTLIPIESEVLDYLAAAEALYVWCAENAEKPGVPQLLALADRREKQGAVALKDALYSDEKRAGMAEAVRDVEYDGYYDNAWAMEHDTGW